MSYYPIFLDLQNRSVLVVGGGVVAEGKTEKLLESGARVRVVSPELTPRLIEWSKLGLITHRQGEFTEEDMESVALVVSATGVREVNETVARAAAARGLWCNVVDQPALCSFITPSVVTRGRLQIAISTGGGSPSLAQRIKREISESIGKEYGELLELVAGLRKEVQQLLPRYEDRRDLLHAVVESTALDCLREGRADDAERIARQIVEEFLRRRQSSPGDGEEGSCTEEQFCT